MGRCRFRCSELIPEAAQPPAPHPTWIIRKLRFCPLAWKIGRTKICSEPMGVVGSYWAVLRKALASWTFIKNLRLASSSQVHQAIESRKAFCSTRLEALPEEIDWKQM